MSITHILQHNIKEYTDEKASYIAIVVISLGIINKLLSNTIN